MRALYNEIDRYCCDWLQNLMDAGHITPGKIDDRSIVDLNPEDLAGYERVHFFAGIGGWDVALGLAGWGNRLVWTGSCPCQPLSSAGKRQGHADKRHLWPAFYDLIAQCGPATIFGEQVASKDGREWLAGIRADLEVAHYAVGGADLCAASAGAPHIRQRLWWLAHADGRLSGNRNLQSSGQHGQQPQDGGTSGGLVHTNGAAVARLEPVGIPLEPQQEAGRSLHADAWARFETVRCADGETRRIEPGVLPVAHGISNRLGRLGGYGNAIVPQVAAQFIGASIEALSL